MKIYIYIYSCKLPFTCISCWLIIIRVHSPTAIPVVVRKWRLTFHFFQQVFVFVLHAAFLASSKLQGTSYLFIYSLLKIFTFADDNYDLISDLELSPTEDNGIDYSPFRSKVQALLFFLIHSPRPMV